MNRSTVALLLIALLFSNPGFTKDMLNPKEYLYKGQQLSSSNGVYSLLMRDDGVLALYQAGIGQVWSASNNTSGCTRANYAQFYYDLTLWGKYEKHIDGECPSWTSRTNTTPNYNVNSTPLMTYLRLQDDGNIVITAVDTPWNSRTYSTIVQNSSNIIIPPGTVLLPGTEYNIGQYKLIFQGDGNLVLSKGGVLTWASWTQNKGASKAVMQHDGNFVIYNLNNQPLWHTKTDKKPGAYLAFQVDGNLVIYHPLAVWARWGVALDKPKTVIYPENQFGPINIPIWSW